MEIKTLWKPYYGPNLTWGNPITTKTQIPTIRRNGSINTPWEAFWANPYSQGLPL